MKRLFPFVLIYVLSSLSGVAHAQGVGAKPQVYTSRQAWRNPNQQITARVHELMSELTLPEKISFLYWHQPAIPRLGIREYQLGDEGLHGEVRPGDVKFTMFPEAIALAASFDPNLLFKVAAAISDENRAEWNATGGVHLDVDTDMLTIWSPVVNLARDPRWGRTQETYGEDPYLTSRLGVAFVKGIQGNDPHYLKVVSTPKHFAVYDDETGRGGNNNIVGDRYLYEYDLMPFKACIKEGHAESIMSSYSAINGIPCSADRWLLTDVLRKQWGFDGYVVSDCGAVSNVVDLHNFLPSPEASAAVCLNSGLDMEGGWFSRWPDVVDNYLIPALNDHLVSQEVVDRAVTHVLTARFKLGMYDPPALVPYSKIPASDIDCPAHQTLARTAADETIVLLKNQPVAGKPLLPIDCAAVKQIVVVGPYADVTQFGGYSKEGPPTMQISPYEGLSAASGANGFSVTYLQWTPGTPLTTDQTAQVTGADLVIGVFGLNTGIENEGQDRTTIALPADQEQYLESIYVLNPHMVAVLEGGSAIASPWLTQNVPAILDAWYPGEEGGAGIADVLLGSYNPSGRLPLTFYADDSQLRPMDEYDLTKGRTYMYLAGKPEYAFGYGLSYTTFRYDALTLSAYKSSDHQPIVATVKLTNTGDRDGSEVVQCYVHARKSSVPMPIRQLWAFQRVVIPKGQTRTVTLQLNTSNFGHYDSVRQGFVVEPGSFDIEVGGSSDNLPLRCTVTVAP